MYLMATHIPIYLDGQRTFVDDSWFSDLDLARRFFAPAFGPVRVLGPSLPIELADSALMREVGPDTPDLSLHPSIDERTRLRHWPKAARQWKQDMAPLLAEAKVVHASVDDPFRPMQLAALRAGIKAQKTTVMIGFDMDVWDVLPDKLKSMGAADATLHLARTCALDLWARKCARRASVAMLKEGLVYDRYAGGAHNPKSFCHSMHSDRHLIDDASYERRLSEMRAGGPLRFGYFGRFVPRKGLADSIRILAAARARGVDASYHLIGEGPQKAELESLARELGVAEHVKFPGSFPYGDALHAELRRMDGLLFTPTEEDTPRMIYDAYAAGLPVIGTKIAFLRLRAERDKAATLIDIGAIEQGADILVQFDEDRESLATLSNRARAAGEHHTVENWYGRRLQWTLDAHGPV